MPELSSSSSLLSSENVKISAPQEKLKISNKASCSNWTGRKVVLGVVGAVGVATVAFAILSGFGVIALALPLLALPLMTEIVMGVAGSLITAVALYVFLREKNTSKIAQEKSIDTQKQPQIAQEKPSNISPLGRANIIVDRDDKLSPEEKEALKKYLTFAFLNPEMCDKIQELIEEIEEIQKTKKEISKEDLDRIPDLKGIKPENQEQFKLSFFSIYQSLINSESEIVTLPAKADIIVLKNIVDADSGLDANNKKDLEENIEFTLSKFSLIEFFRKTLVLQENRKILDKIENISKEPYNEIICKMTRQNKMELELLLPSELQNLERLDFLVTCAVVATIQCKPNYNALVRELGKDVSNQELGENISVID